MCLFALRSTNLTSSCPQMRELAKGDEYLRRYIHKHMSVACLAAVALSVLRCAALCCQQLILVAVSCNGPLCRRQQLAALHTPAHWLPTAAHQMPTTRLHPASSPALAPAPLFACGACIGRHIQTSRLPLPAATLTRPPPTEINHELT